MGIVHLGDCRAIMGLMADNSVDSIVTDPPYELGFMGKGWDSSGIAYDVEVWRECLRILKPGGYLVAFGGSRTYHRIACAIEDAGFVMRDGLQWIYGSGFPKSLDISKAIDKLRVDDLLPVRTFLRAARDAAGLTNRQIADHFGFTPTMASHWIDHPSQPTIPTVDQWRQLKSLIGFGDDLDAEVLRLNDRKRTPGEDWQSREITGTVDAWENRTNYALHGADQFRRDVPQSAAALEWQGYGTALKPAVEPIALAQKPLDGTYARNILAHGVGALNIAGCRIGDDQRHNAAAANKPGGVALQMSATGMPTGVEGSDVIGRWPANILFGHSPDCADVCVEGCPVAALDAQSGVSSSAATVLRSGGDDTPHGIYGKYADRKGQPLVGYADTGGASRYFAQFRFEADDWFAPFYYTAKAGRKERDRGLQSLRTASPAEMLDRKPDSAGLKHARAGANHGGGKNIHPTVKPVSVMRWLCRLVTPKGGLVFDPFTGSGTTYVATVREHLRFAGSELLPDHQEIAQMRGDYELTKGAQGSIFDMFEGVQ